VKLQLWNSGNGLHFTKRSAADEEAVYRLETKEDLDEFVRSLEGAIAFLRSAKEGDLIYVEDL
jgi:hypothetical protein